MELLYNIYIIHNGTNYLILCWDSFSNVGDFLSLTHAFCWSYNVHIIGQIVIRVFAFYIIFFNTKRDINHTSSLYIKKKASMTYIHAQLLI